MSNNIKTTNNDVLITVVIGMASIWIRGININNKPTEFIVVHHGIPYEHENEKEFNCAPRYDETEKRGSQHHSRHHYHW